MDRFARNRRRRGRCPWLSVLQGRAAVRPRHDHPISVMPTHLVLTHPLPRHPAKASRIDSRGEQCKGNTAGDGKPGTIEREPDDRTYATADAALRDPDRRSSRCDAALSVSRSGRQIRRAATHFSAAASEIRPSCMGSCRGSRRLASISWKSAASRDSPSTYHSTRSGGSCRGTLVDRVVSSFKTVQSACSTVPCR